MVAFEIIKIIMLPYLNNKITIGENVKKPKNHVNLGRSFIFTNTGLIYSLEYGFATSVPPTNGKIGYVILKTLFDLKIFRLPFDFIFNVGNFRGNFVCTSNPHKNNYYHFIIDTLPYLQNSVDNTDILLNNHQETLLKKFRSYSDKNFNQVRESQSQIVLVENAVVLPYKSLFDRVECVNRLIHLNTRKNIPGIFVCRDDAIERRIKNWDEVKQFLNKIGFVSFNPSKQTVRQNLESFQRAEIIIGAHGAGLTDVIFCNEPKLIEIVGGRYNNAYKELIKIKGGRYSRMNANQVGPDLCIDTEILNDKIRKLRQHLS
jgi:hypothetical protein